MNWAVLSLYEPCPRPEALIEFWECFEQVVSQILLGISWIAIRGCRGADPNGRTHSLSPTDKSCPWYRAVGHATGAGWGSTTAFPHAGNTANVSHLKESRRESRRLENVLNRQPRAQMAPFWVYRHSSSLNCAQRRDLIPKSIIAGWCWGVWG